MTVYKILFLAGVMLSQCGITQAQNSTSKVLPHRWTLSECETYALEHNITVKQQDVTRRQREVELSTARNSRLPNLDATASQNFSFGRGLTSNNTYEDTNTGSTSFNLGTSVPLFTGFQIPNTIKLNKLNLAAATADMEKAKNDIRTQVAQAYVEILYDMEISDVARRQVAIDSMQVVRLRAMVNNGKASGAELSQQMATEAQGRLTATQADNNYKLALLTLSQLLELDSPEGFSVVRPDVSGLTAGNILESPDAVFSEAIGIRPEIEAEKLRLEGSDRSIDIAKAALYPQLSFSAGLGTNYYKTSGYDTDGFMKQIKNNFSQYVGLSLSVPIFNRFSTRNSIRSARLNRETQVLQLENTKKTLYKEIQQVYYNAVAAKSKYESSVSAKRSSEDAFKLTQAKYENGKANITEFNESKNSYLKSESDLAQARYEYLYQTHLLDFYKGKTLSF